MQVIIDQITSRIRSFDSTLSEQTVARLVRAVLEAMDARELERERTTEEMSLLNYQQRNQPWRR
jgi:hypothetical protein